ncbi:MAG: AbrB/MazE/SpoVT family DNA-binding domain-containing protein [Nitrospinae bacterium]|nr:AbrB/MazE/SpoVT family DNA-binding domain-containing protein [Nitrospinota bacterium]
MQTKAQKWGNSLAFRIPSAFAREIGIGPGDEMDIAVSDGQLVVAPVRGKKLSLKKLLAGVTKKNLHKPVDTGPSTGKELW